MNTEHTEQQQYSTDLVSINSLDVVPSFDVATISDAEFNDKYTLLIDYLDKLTELKKKVDSGIKATMEEQYNATGETNLISGDRKYTYIPPTTRVSVDTKKLQAELPDVYAQYVKIGQVSATLKSTTINKK